MLFPAKKYLPEQLHTIIPYSLPPGLNQFPLEINCIFISFIELLPDAEIFEIVVGQAHCMAG